MRGMLAPLSPHDEAALRKIAVGRDDSLERAHVRRLLLLELVEGASGVWQLTPVGRQRCLLLDGLGTPTMSHEAALKSREPPNADGR